MRAFDFFALERIFYRFVYLSNLLN